MTVALPHYDNPPIQEVICEIHFPKIPNLTDETLKKIGVTWNALYPKQQTVEEQLIELQFNLQQAKADQRKLGKKLICHSQDSKRLVQLTSHLLAINQLAPYQGWDESFCQIIIDRFNEVKQSFSFSSVLRIGLRYINKIEIPETPLKWDRWFNFKLPIPYELSSKTAFHLRFEHDLEKDLKMMINIATVQPSSPEKTAILLDLDVVSYKAATTETLGSELNRIHSFPGKAFEEYISNETRALFKPCKLN